MRGLASKHFSDDLPKSIWLNRLPANIKLVLVASKDGLNSLAAMADWILELIPRINVNYIEISPKVSNNLMLKQKVSHLAEQSL
ncbi:hypothetical protein TNIN_430131 [Trichonephila inaurata madagascariensis]|uniref:Uncharacterized protein n=1 Tax=Trichonephila inaurata madagascariensis TaxID=2747483 RepID=A0A8X6XZP4_9ARAC|nr:hypothetical protein TNIN_430131 [Trichonephila inaurata madagascariensis]